MALSETSGGFAFLECYLRIVRSYFEGRTYLFRWPSPKSRKSLRARVQALTDRHGLTRLLAKLRGRRGHELRRWIRRIPEEWPMSRFHDAHALSELTGTIRSPGPPNAA